MNKEALRDLSRGLSGGAREGRGRTWNIFDENKLTESLKGGSRVGECFVCYLIAWGSSSRLDNQDVSL